MNVSTASSVQYASTGITPPNPPFAGGKGRESALTRSRSRDELKVWKKHGTCIGTSHLIAWVPATSETFSRHYRNFYSNLSPITQWTLIAEEAVTIGVDCPAP